jgi:hypothetical protein
MATSVTDDAQLQSVVHAEVPNSAPEAASRERPVAGDPSNAPQFPLLGRLLPVTVFPVSPACRQRPPSAGSVRIAYIATIERNQPLLARGDCV